MADYYKLVADGTFATPVGETTDFVQAATYGAGDYISSDELSEKDQERAKNGELDHLLESVSEKEVEEAASRDDRLVRIPEHEVERYIEKQAGRVVVERDQLLELKSAGAEGDADSQAQAYEGGASERPRITEQDTFVEVPSLVEASQGDADGVVPTTSDKVSDEKLAGVEQPPGLPVGPTLEAASAAEQPKTRKRRARPAAEGDQA